MFDSLLEHSPVRVEASSGVDQGGGECGNDKKMAEHFHLTQKKN